MNAPIATDKPTPGTRRDWPALYRYMFTHCSQKTLRSGVTALGVFLLVACGGAGGEREGTAPRDAASKKPSAPAAGAVLVTMYKNPTCQCCGEWAEHLRASGFKVDIRQGEDLTLVRARHGVSNTLASCHTALVNGYVLEGHVPADVIHQLLKERPAVAGLAVPGMPPGVPGMPDVGSNRAKYQVVAFEKGGATRVYAER